MKEEQIKTMQDFGPKGKDFGEHWDKFFESAFFIHGHICGGMPLGFRAGVLALKSLGAERESNMGKLAFVETGTGHAAGCFADGVQMATGCTFGKGLMERTQYGKWAFTLVDKSTRKAVRVSVRPQVIQNAFKSPFVQMRKDGVPPTEIPMDISRGFVEGMLAKKDEELFQISEIFEYPLPEAPKPTFELATCSVCGEAIAANKARVKDGEAICLPCSGYQL